MSTARLTFLYPHPLRTARWSSEAVVQVSRRGAAAPRRKGANPPANCQNAPASFSTSAHARQTHLPKRHGKAVDHLPPHSASRIAPPSPTAAVAASAAATAAAAAAVAAEPAKASDPGAASRGGAADIGNVEGKTIREDLTTEARSAGASSPETSSGAKDADTKIEEPPPSGPTAVDATATVATTTLPPELLELNKDAKNTSGPMDSILQMSPPEEAAHKPPHLTPPPYVHHFDSYSLVKQLEAGGYTQEQAITAMKAVRGLLAHNLDVAQEGLVSKSDVENETYLFRAACSELSAEVRNNRRVADESMRQQRTMLQHEVDILTQSLNQELLTLNDAVRGMFNDRRMAVREEQKTVDAAIQQISYKISVMLNSETRSRIEQLRWVLIRRSVLGIIFMAVLTLGSLRYASHVSHERQKEIDRAAREAEQAKKSAGRQDYSPAPNAAEILSAN